MKLNNVKVSSKDLEMLRKFFGVKGGGLNLENGVFRVSSEEEVFALAERFEIENVNWVSLDDFKTKCQSSEKMPAGENLSTQSDKTSLQYAESSADKKQGSTQQSDESQDSKISEVSVKRKASEYSLEERLKIIGTRIKIGSILRIKGTEKVIHVLITKVSSEGYQGRKLRLNVEGYNPDTEEILKKGEEVIYKNLTYKALITVTEELIVGITNQNLFWPQGGPIVGRLISEEKIKKILAMPKTKVTDHETLLKGAKGKVTSAGKTEDKEGVSGTPNLETSKTQKIKGQERIPESVSKVPEKLVCEVEETVSGEDEAEKISVEECLEKANSLEEFLTDVNLKDTLLEHAIKLSVESRHANMKKLLPMLQESLSSKKLTQNAFKNQMNEELENWCKNGYALKEGTVTYLLKVTVKKFKN